MYRHGGNLRELARRAARPLDEILDFSANINPLGPPSWLPSVIHKNVPAVIRYPDPEAQAFVAAVASLNGTSPGEVVAGNGASALLHALPGIIEGRRAVVPVPSYADYLQPRVQAGGPAIAYGLREEDDFELNPDSLTEALRDGDVVILGQPNNPTGRLVNPDALRRLIQRRSEVLFVVDEAFAGFVPGYRSLVLDRPANAVVLWSLTKLYAIPGLRLGCAFLESDLASRLRSRIGPWTVNVFAQAVGHAALEDPDFVLRTQAFVSARRQELCRALAAIDGLTIYPGCANFLLARIDLEGSRASTVARHLLREEGIGIRVCDNFEGLDDRFFRVAVRTRTENARLCRALTAALVRSGRR